MPIPFDFPLFQTQFSDYLRTGDLPNPFSSEEILKAYIDTLSQDIKQRLSNKMWHTFKQENKLQMIFPDTDTSLITLSEGLKAGFIASGIVYGVSQNSDLALAVGPVTGLLWGYRHACQMRQTHKTAYQAYQTRWKKFEAQLPPPMKEIPEEDFTIEILKKLREPAFIKR